MKDEKCPTCKGTGRQGATVCMDCRGSGLKWAYDGTRKLEEHNTYPLPDPDEEEQLGGA